MNLHEYQAKHLFAQLWHAGADGEVVWNAEEAL